MKIIINDYAGHPFQVQLSRNLAHRGHEVLHAYCSSVQTPQASLIKSHNDPETFRIKAISLNMGFDKYGLFSRWKQEKELGDKLSNLVNEFRPDVIISANTPLRAQACLIRSAKKAGSRFVFWMQDVLGVGIGKALEQRIGRLGFYIGAYMKKYEKKLLLESDHIIVITDDFLPYIPDVQNERGIVTTIENWAPINEIPVSEKINDWSVENELADKFCFIYSGTLGVKHNPEMLIALAQKTRVYEHVKIVVISEGQGADYLNEARKQLSLDNLLIFPFQPFEILPKVLASADVLLALLEKDAGTFAVPSKVLTYLCTGKPLLVAIPKENLAARIIRESGSGVLVDPWDIEAFTEKALDLMCDEKKRIQFGNNGRRYAEHVFDIEEITDRFESIILGKPFGKTCNKKVTTEIYTKTVN